MVLREWEVYDSQPVMLYLGLLLPKARFPKKIQRPPRHSLNLPLQRSFRIPSCQYNVVHTWWGEHADFFQPDCLSFLSAITLHLPHSPSKTAELLQIIFLPLGMPLPPSGPSSTFIPVLSISITVLPFHLARISIRIFTRMWLFVILLSIFPDGLKDWIKISQFTFLS